MTILMRIQRVLLHCVARVCYWMSKLRESSHKKELLSSFQHPRKGQEQVLQRILSMIDGTKRIKELGICRTTTIQEFRKKHPITDYTNYQEAVEGIVAGTQEASTLIGRGKLFAMQRTSGTTSKPKFVPLTWQGVQRNPIRKAIAFTTSFFDSMGRDGTGKRFLINVLGDVEVNCKGIKIGTLVTVSLKSNYGRLFWAAFNTSYPHEVLMIRDRERAFFLQATFTFLSRLEVCMMYSVFSFSSLLFFQFLEEHFDVLVDLVHTGNERLARSKGLLDDEGSAILRRHGFRADPTLARALSAAAASGFEGIAPRLFPKCAFLQAITTGSMAQHVPHLKRYLGSKSPSHCCGGIHLVSEHYGQPHRPACCSRSPPRPLLFKRQARVQPRTPGTRLRCRLV